MKKSVDILGLQVISISEGKELGSVKGLVINSSEGSVAALIIDDGKWYLGAKLLPFSAIAGIGEYAVTVEGSDEVLSVSTAPDYEKLLAADIRIIDTKIVTKTGRILGKVVEFNIDENGKIVACDIEDVKGEALTLAAQRVITFGKQVTVIAEEDAFITETTVPVTKEPPVQPKEEVAPAPVVKTALPVEAAEKQQEEPEKKVDDKHRKFLLGKKASRRIETDNGVIIVDQGGEITEEVLQKAKLAGKFVELSMNIQ
ncbi:PRC-barrel domain-containing protein [Propionispora hippei]|uniref:PRC-barrel domain-containing protein n=1 Tax=Propionispora hippei DSM 15287 TaxID=1123003 RepID=A0A1M6AX86_9FIRM|nr:PRC-barrel domain-containing protein [Propionispora hippei]SHI40938.1 PRC-barrel domain-containing protein [Propionispora hippei DSM 15287]